MKYFFRTVAGKALLFVFCVLSLCVLTGSVIGAVGLLSEDAYFYTHTESEVLYNLVGHQLWSDGYSRVLEAIEHNTASYNGKLSYEVLAEDGTRLAHTEDADDFEYWDYSFTYSISEVLHGNSVYGSEYYSNLANERGLDTNLYTINMSVTDSPSEYYLIKKIVHIAYALRYGIYGIGFGSLFLSLICFIPLMYVSARRKDTDEIVPGPLNRVPYDVMLAACVFMVAAICGLLAELLNARDNYMLIALIPVFAITVFALFTGLCMSTAARIKQHNLLKNTLIWFICGLIRKLFLLLFAGLKKLHGFNSRLVRSIPIIWKTALGAVGLSIIEFIFLAAFYDNVEPLVFFFILEKLLLIPGIMYIAVCLRRLQAGGRALAAGDLSCVTDTKGLFGDFKAHAEDLNSAAVGMTIAVEDRLKSERMKTELITNVSHDIKTPLTSIINYAGLIGNEPCENEKIKEYVEVLTRQSERLKRLIEDLVEASKASTGNLDVKPAPCDAAVFISQADGEYEEKLQAAGLTLITSQPEKEIRIMADGRRMWRIFDNLMNNICKYSLSGTRVYLSLEEIGGNAVITFKNTSRDPLNMSEEELMERFTRGDSSRNTEGNGLGLSIARSMAELQGGSLKLIIDGDLFKAILTFPTITA